MWLVLLGLLWQPSCAAPAPTLAAPTIINSSGSSSSSSSVDKSSSAPLIDDLPLLRSTNETVTATATAATHASAPLQQAPLLALASAHGTSKSVNAAPRLPTNATALLQQARTGLTTALREVKNCRAQRDKCVEELNTCHASAGPTDVARLHEAQAATRLAQAAQTALQKRNSEYTELRSRAETISTTAQRQLAQVRKELGESRAAADACVRRRESESAQQVQVQAQLGVLRRKLEQKEQIENAIEGKHSKLTEVYKSLESECQVELDKCRTGSATTPGEKAAHAPDGPLPPDGVAAPGEASASCTRAGWLGGGSAHELRLLGGVFAAGVLVGWAMRGPRGARTAAAGTRARGGGLPHVEEMRGWMPVAAADMKLS